MTQKTSKKEKDKKPKKIMVLEIIGEINCGGSEKQLLETVKNIDKKKFELFVCSLTKKNNPKLIKEFKKNCEIIILKKILPIDITRIQRIGAIIKEKKIDVVHCSLSTANTWGTIAAKLEKKPLIISFLSKPKGQSTLEKIRDAILSKAADTIITNSKSNANYLQENITKEKNKIVVINNCVDTNYYNPKNKKTEAIKTIGIIAGLKKPKNHELFLQAAKIVSKEFPKIKFFVVGDGPKRKKLEDLTKKLSLKNIVFFLGEKKDARDCLEKIDLFVLTSDWEGMPNAIMEAMAMEKPIVATNVGGIKELITNGIEGYLVEPKNPESLAKKIKELIENPQLCEAMGKAGRKKMRDFSIEKTINAKEKVFESLIKSAKKAGKI